MFIYMIYKLISLNTIVKTKLHVAGSFVFDNAPTSSDSMHSMI